MARVPGVAVVSHEQDLVATYAGGWIALAGVDDAFLTTHALHVAQGSGTLGPGTALVTSSFARQDHLRVGQPIVVATAGTSLPVRIGGVVDGTAATAQVLVPLATLVKAGIQRQDSALMVMMSPGADAAQVRHGLERAAASAPYVSVDDKQQFSQQLHDTVDKLIYLIDALLALAIVIAVLGIVNTLSLSVFERTRELGLLRAVGMTRAQVRRMVTLESVAIALLGAVVGLALGVLIGVLLRQSLAADLTSLGLPLADLLRFLVAAVVIGVLAAVGPGIRAARMSPLAAAAEE
jgi:putative ABC transport system permease protein